MATVEFDPLAPMDDPYPIYRRLRDEAPVHHNAARRMWSVTRFDDVMHVLKTPEIFSSRAMFTMIMAGGRGEVAPPPFGFIPLLWKNVTPAPPNPRDFFPPANQI